MAQNDLSITILITQKTNPTKLHQNKCWFKMRGKKQHKQDDLSGKSREPTTPTQTKNNIMIIIIIVSLLWEH